MCFLKTFKVISYICVLIKVIDKKINLTHMSIIYMSINYYYYNV